jgi:hypothetical protein
MFLRIQRCGTPAVPASNSYDHKGLYAHDLRRGETVTCSFGIG